VTPEARLERAHDRLADSRKRRLRPRRRADSIHHLVRLWIDEHLEELFTRLRVVRQGSVGEAELSNIIRAANSVENTTTVQGPEPQVVDENRHDGSNRDRCIPRERFDPADVELFPRDQCGSRSLEVCFAASNRHHLLIETVEARLAVDDSDWTIRERKFLRVAQETVDCQS